LGSRRWYYDVTGDVVDGEFNMADLNGSPQIAARDDIFTIRELSEHLRVHPTTIYRLLRQGRLPGFRVGSNWRFNRTAIEQWEHTQLAGFEAPVSTRGRRKRQSN
jgi:excisionase family DNA binding protein